MCQVKLAKNSGCLEFGTMVVCRRKLAIELERYCTLIRHRTWPRLGWNRGGSMGSHVEAGAVLKAPSFEEVDKIFGILNILREINQDSPFLISSNHFSIVGCWKQMTEKVKNILWNARNTPLNKLLKHSHSVALMKRKRIKS